MTETAVKKLQRCSRIKNWPPASPLEPGELPSSQGDKAAGAKAKARAAPSRPLLLSAPRGKIPKGTAQGNKAGLFQMQRSSEARLVGCASNLQITLPARTGSLMEGRPVSGWASRAFLLPPSDSRPWDTAKANRAAARPTLLDYLYLQAKYMQLKTFHICLVKLAVSLMISVILGWQDKPPLTTESLWYQQTFKGNKGARLFHKGVSVQGCCNHQMPPLQCPKSWSNLLKGPSQSQSLHPQCQPEGKPTCLLP